MHVELSLQKIYTDVFVRWKKYLDQCPDPTTNIGFDLSSKKGVMGELKVHSAFLHSQRLTNKLSSLKVDMDQRVKSANGLKDTCSKVEDLITKFQKLINSHKREVVKIAYGPYVPDLGKGYKVFIITPLLTIETYKVSFFNHPPDHIVKKARQQKDRCNQIGRIISTLQGILWSLNDDNAIHIVHTAFKDLE